MNKQVVTTIEYDEGDFSYATGAFGDYRATAQHLASQPRITNVRIITTEVSWRGRNGKKQRTVLNTEHIAA